MFNSGKIHLFKVNSRNIWERCNICSKLTTKTQERCHWHRFGIFIVNFDNFFTPFPNVSIVDIEHKFVCWKVYYTQKSLQALSIKANKCSYALSQNKFTAYIYLFKVNNRKTRRRCEICSKLTIKIEERRQWGRFGVFIVNFEHITHLFLVFLWL